jgi:hypothetical protein
VSSADTLYIKAPESPGKPTVHEVPSKCSKKGNEIWFWSRIPPTAQMSLAEVAVTDSR